MIVTSHDRLGSTDESTGLWFEELAAPYVEFDAAGMDIDIASPKGERRRSILGACRSRHRRSSSSGRTRARWPRPSGPRS
jgi:putative intracellular protease/amidase